MALFTIANKIQLACSWACNSNGQCSLLLLRTILKFQSFRLIWSLFHITYFGEWGNFISLWIVNWRFLLLFKSDTSNWLTFLCTNLGEYWSFPSKATVCLFIDFKQTKTPTIFSMRSSLSLEIITGLLLFLPDLQCSPCFQQYLVPESAAESDSPKRWLQKGRPWEE